MIKHISLLCPSTSSKTICRQSWHNHLYWLLVLCSVHCNTQTSCHVSLHYLPSQQECHHQWWFDQSICQLCIWCMITRLLHKYNSDYLSWPFWNSLLGSWFVCLWNACIHLGMDTVVRMLHYPLRPCDRL